MDEWMNGWMDGWMDRRMDYIPVYMYVKHISNFERLIRYNYPCTNEDHPQQQNVSWLCKWFVALDKGLQVHIIYSKPLPRL